MSPAPVSDALRYRGAVLPAQVEVARSPGAPNLNRPSIQPPQDRLVPVCELARRTAGLGPDESTATPLRTLSMTWPDGSFAPARIAAVGPDGTVVALTASGRMARWRPEDGDDSRCVDLGPVQNGTPEVDFALVIADGTLVTAPETHDLRHDGPEALAWKADGTLIGRLGGHKERITALASSPNGTVVTASSDRSLRIHVAEQAGAAAQWRSALAKKDHDTVVSMAFATDDALFTVSMYGRIDLYHRPVGQSSAPYWQAEPSWRFGGMRSEPEVSVIAAGPGTDFITGGADGLVKLWPRVLRHKYDDPSCPARRIFTGHKKAVTAVALDQVGRIVSASEDATVRVWRPSSGDCLATFVHPAPVRALSIAPNGTVVTCADDGVVRVWSAPWGSR